MKRNNEILQKSIHQNKAGIGKRNCVRYKSAEKDKSSLVY